MHFITSLPLSHGSTIILVIVDQLTKYAHFCSLLTHFTTAKIDDLFVDLIIKHHGFPPSIVSDHDLHMMD